MEKGQANTVVKVISVLYWIEAAFMLLFGLFILIMGSALGALGTAYQGMGMFGGLFGALAAFFGLFMLIIGVCALVTGFGIWKHKSWARVVATIVSVVGLFSFPIGTIINGGILYFLWFNDDVKKLFN
ncbi:hypothetical protein J4476_00155 [Candidatus Woesearchaeota archaeon]|nr:MAG: hypothetical protein QT09_C0010G0003 [archaeon GW2011_AR18]MBS3161096.1 hypothetical protein [Candidatus Woesearchaeota archaeon]HIH25504.1 hypothetical protein [Nanoarchaeota archaeon]